MSLKYCLCLCKNEIYIVNADVDNYKTCNILSANYFERGDPR